MLRKFAKPLVVLLVTAALAVPVIVSTASPAPAQERHPVIHEAMEKIQSARTDLQKYAARDFEGHRAKAVGHLDQALEQLKLALQSDPN